METPIRIAILEDHLATIDGYLYRLGNRPDISILGTLMYGEALEPFLQQTEVDVLLLDLQVPTSPENANPYPILHMIPKILQDHPRLNILVISLYGQRTLIQSCVDAGVSGYILKDDTASIQELPSIIHSLVTDGIYFSQKVFALLKRARPGDKEPVLSTRQLEALSLCLAYPDETTSSLARRMGIADSTFRNLLSGVYVKLDVRSRAAAIARARQKGLITPDIPNFET